MFGVAVAWVANHFPDSRTSLQGFHDSIPESSKCVNTNPPKKDVKTYQDNILNMWIEHRLSKNHILNTWISKDTLFSDFICNVPSADHAYECATDIYWITKEYHKHGKVSLLTSQPAENPEDKVAFRLTKHQFTNRNPKTSTLNGLEGKSIDFYIKYGVFL